ncbi:sulfatase [Paraglaciecola aquimarina]|uniref:Sulfatase n=1 Tax=Paraglaciecola aquimarina TaxID=1235557 RepID=A0ABU3SV25_9ALTE|nr:sulfatase [Paraglaciecola aquimarina]MDU0353880.1 sulfatase [Paraglaciecola aquimarina]
MKIVLLILTWSLLSAFTFAAPKETLPNIIFIFADDLGYGDLSRFGAKDIATPNIDQLGKQGITFTEFYSASSICSPSRAALLTGRMPQRMGINGVFFPDSWLGMPPEEVTIAEVLKTKNYYTGMVGKWHLGHHHKFLPKQQGFDEYFGIPYSNDMDGVVYMRDNDVESMQVDQSLITQTYTQESLAFIEKNKHQPFFLYVSHNMPHTPIYASKAFLGSSKRGLYGDVIQELDWSVGQIVNKVEELGLLDNTLIIFSSDNGPWLAMKEFGGSAGGLREGKMYTFEGGMRVPTLAMWKGKIPAGKQYNNVVTQMDWFPTFAAITHATLNKNIPIDGEDISNVLTSNGTRNSTFVYFDNAKIDGYRSGDWKLKLPYQGYAGSHWKNAVAAHDLSLFNLKSDPAESINLASKYPKKVAKLQHEMLQQVKRLGELPANITVRQKADLSQVSKK